MAELVEVKVPDIGDFADVPIIEVFVSAGDEVAPEDPLITLESDKATMDVPAPAAGKVAELKVAVGDTRLGGLADPAARAGLHRRGGAREPATPTVAEPAVTEPAAPAAPAAIPDADVRVQVAVLGAGPGGYTAAFRAADLGFDVALIERRETLGGVCLNVGCIPSKALLHVAKVLAGGRGAGRVRASASASRRSTSTRCGRGRSRSSGSSTGGLDGLAKQRKVQVVRGDGALRRPEPHRGQEATATRRSASSTASSPPGSSAASLPFLPDDPRIMDSTGALELDDVPERLLVIGGGIIGLEMATVYDALGSEVTVVELLDQLIPGCDPDLVRPLQKRISRRYAAIHLDTTVAASRRARRAEVTFGRRAPRPSTASCVAVGRRPNGTGIGAEAAGVAVDERGFIARRRAAAHQRRRTSSRSATWWASRCSPTRRRTRARSPRR